ncbi:MAG: hypothetical protein H8D37_04120 [Chloroflexi bacterium]|nr:hypothetical protein [Chloroflexota bacterium]
MMTGSAEVSGASFGPEGITALGYGVSLGDGSGVGVFVGTVSPSGADAMFGVGKSGLGGARVPPLGRLQLPKRLVKIINKVIILRMAVISFVSD